MLGAWSGLFGMYLPVTAFSIWFLVMFYVMRKAALEEIAAAGHAVGELAEVG